MPVPDLVFAQPARRNILVPVLLSLFILGIVVALLLRFTPHSTATLTVTRTAILPTHTVFKGESILVGRDTAQDDLYVVTTLRVEDNLHIPLFIKDLTATLVTADGQQVSTSAAEEHDLPNIYTSFPALKPLSSAPLLRESLIDPGQTAEGMVLLHFPVTQAVWDHRRSATLTVDLYHQGPEDALITRASEAVKIPTGTPANEPPE